MKRPAALLLVCLASFAGPGAAQETDSPSREEILSRLVAELGQLEEGVAPETVATRLPALMSGAPELLFDALAGELALADGSALAISEAGHAALLGGARRLGRAALVGPWSVGASGTAAQRRAAIELVGLCGQAADLETALQAATPATLGEAFDPEALNLLEEAASRLLVRAPDMLVVLRPAILHAPPEISSRLVRSLGRAPDERTLAFLADLLDFDERLELPLLSEIEGVARRSSPPFDESLCATVRAYLDSADRQLARTAATTLAVLRDEAAVPALIELCASTDAALSGAAFLALERTTGLPLPRRPERWRSWLRAEQLWASTERASVFAALESGDVTQILAALRTLAAHRLERRLFAEKVAPFLEHSDPGVRAQACSTLGALAQPESERALERMLSDPDARVSAAAKTALSCLRTPA